MFKTFPDNKVGESAVQNLFAADDRTCSISWFTGTMSEPMTGADGSVIPPTGQSLEWTSAPSPTGKTG